MLPITQNRLFNPQVKVVGPLIKTELFTDTKDPCPVFDGKLWHIFGSAGDKRNEIWRILHATAFNIEGPWKLENPSYLHHVNDSHACAPGVICDYKEKLLHMFVQTDFMDVGGTVEHLISADGGENFIHVGTPLRSRPFSKEAGIYDPHPAVINEEKYLVYSAFPVKAHGDIYLAKSQTNSWFGPWDRLGPLLTHIQVPFHNAHDFSDYEWGLEGPQLIQLPNKSVLLIAACFLPLGQRGTRQRVFFSIANQVSGPYHPIGLPLVPPGEGWDGAENGHSAGVIIGNQLNLFFQARGFHENDRWRYGLIKIPLSKLQSVCTIPLLSPFSIPDVPEAVTFS